MEKLSKQTDKSQVGRIVSNLLHHSCHQPALHLNQLAEIFIVQIDSTLCLVLKRQICAMKKHEIKLKMAKIF